MSYGSDEAIQDAEDVHREHCARLIAQCAAQLVAAHDMGRDEAIQAITNWMRLDGEAEADPTGVMALENAFPSPSKLMPTRQVAAIAHELLEAARDASDTL
ncbi:MAG: hypothetical protein EPO09_01265 [Aquabacterium sp.]|uniref:hypothetical protein n=1 Tax=Aquabacterium sp. TaxID=1872578 RepID=UPI00121EF946|nr:hypothetical protein [Aquabacterium sp.]TAK99358.1 MAG: hypothetical protein EPO09_01265 [Aquabacterium sp.]